MKSAGNCDSNRSVLPSACGKPHWANGIAPESYQQSITSGTRCIARLGERRVVRQASMYGLWTLKSSGNSGFFALAAAQTWPR